MVNQFGEEELFGGELFDLGVVLRIRPDFAVLRE
jgi:hypothetical protein